MSREGAPSARIAWITIAALAWWGGGALGHVAAGGDAIAIIVAKERQASAINLSDLGRIYRGEQETWEDGQKILVVNQGLESEIRKRFYQLVLKSEPAQKFLRPGTPLPFQTTVFKSDRTIRKFVAATPNAIGYVSAAEVDDSVQVLAIEGARPDDGRYPLK